MIDQLHALFEPVGLVWAWLLLATAYCLYHRRWPIAGAFALPALLLSLFGATALPGLLVRQLEEPYAQFDVNALPQADAIVLLGGGAEPTRFEVGGMHLTAAGDRVIMAMELARLRKAPAIVLGGNAVRFGEKRVLESETVRDWMRDRAGVTAELLPLPACSDTHDEAINTATLYRQRGWQQILLVTSANHMPRASATFRAAGMQVVPAPCNFLTEISHASSARFPITVPRAGVTAKMGVWLHEVVGWQVYRWRGWL